MTEWHEDKRWSDRFLPAIKRILGECLIGEPPIEQDQLHNTDLIVLRMEPVRIGCRIRRNQYMHQYSDEFTLRASRLNGTKTELAKILEGWGDYFFYGFSDQREKELQAWFLGDLKVFRLWFYKQVVANRGILPGKELKNIDASSNFYAYKLSELPNNFYVKWDGYAS